MEIISLAAADRQVDPYAVIAGLQGGLSHCDASTTKSSRHTEHVLAVPQRSLASTIDADRQPDPSFDWHQQQAYDPLGTRSDNVCLSGGTDRLSTPVVVSGGCEDLVMPFFFAINTCCW